MPATFSIDGSRLLRTISKKVGKVPKKAGRALRSVGELWMTESKRRVPVMTGALRASGHVTGPMPKGKSIEVILAYGGVAAPYAVIVHENPKAKHKVGQWKYLESVVVENGPTLAKQVKKFM